MNLRGRDKSLSLDVSTISLSRLLAFGLALIIPIVLTWVLSVEDYATYKELSLLVVTIQPILMFGIPSSLRYFIPRGTIMEKRRYMSQALLFSILIGLGFFLLLAFAGGIITEALFKDNYSEFMLVLGAHGFMLITSSYIGVVMIVNDDVKLAGFTAIVFAILDILIMCSFVIIFQTVMALLIGIAFASLIKFIIAIQYIVKHFQPGIALITPSSLRAHLTFSVPMGFTDVVNILHINIDKFFIAFFFSRELFGIYSIGALITPVILVVYRSVVDIIVPQFSKLYKSRNINDLIKLWHESLRKLAMIFYPLFIFLIIFASELIAIFPAAYEESVGVFRLYLILLPLNVTFFSGVLIAMGKSKALFKATAYTLVINVALNYILIKYFIVLGYGLLGPPVATIIANVFLRWLMLAYISNEFMRNATTLFPMRNMMRIMGLAVLTGLVTIGLMLAAGFALFNGALAMPEWYLGASNLLSALNPHVAKFSTAIIGFGIFSAVYYMISRKLDYINQADIDLIMMFLKMKK